MAEKVSASTNMAWYIWQHISKANMNRIALDARSVCYFFPFNLAFIWPDNSWGDQGWKMLSDQLQLFYVQKHNNENLFFSFF